MMEFEFPPDDDEDDPAITHEEAQRVYKELEVTQKALPQNSMGILICLTPDRSSYTVNFVKRFDQDIPEAEFNVLMQMAGAISEVAALPSAKLVAMYQTFLAASMANAGSGRDQLSDTVYKPAHYTYGKYEVIEVLEDWFPKEPLLWQVGKYIARWDRKDTPLENLKKARYYLDRKIMQLEGVEKEREQREKYGWIDDGLTIRRVPLDGAVRPVPTAKAQYLAAGEALRSAFSPSGTMRDEIREYTRG